MSFWCTRSMFLFTCWTVEDCWWLGLHQCRHVCPVWKKEGDAVLPQTIQLSLAPLKPTISDRATWNRTWWSTHSTIWHNIKANPVTCTVPHVCCEAWYEPHGNIWGTILLLSCHNSTSQWKDLTNISCHKILHRLFFSARSCCSFFKVQIHNVNYIVITALLHFYYMLLLYTDFFSGRASPDQKGFSDISMQIFKQMPFARACCIAPPRMIISQFLVKQWKFS